MNLDSYNSKGMYDNFYKTFVVLFLIAEKNILIPTVDLAQSKILKKLQKKLEPFILCGNVKFIGSGNNIVSIIESKQKHYRNSNINQMWFDDKQIEKLGQFEFAFQRRNLSTSKEMLTLWETSLINMDINNGIAADVTEKLIQASMNSINWRAKYTKDLLWLRDGLDEKAFLWSVIEEQRIFPKYILESDKFYFEIVLAHQWIESHLLEFNCSIASNLPMHNKIDFYIAEKYPDNVINITAIISIFNNLGIDDILMDSAEDVIKLKESFIFPSLIDLIKKLSLYQDNRIELHKVINGSNYRNATTNEKIELLVTWYSNKINTTSKGVTYMSMPETIVIIIPLEEEFSTVLDVFKHDSRVKELDTNEQSEYHFDFNGCKIIMSFLGNDTMGNVNSGIATTNLCTKYNPKELYMIGIAGSTNKELKLTDVYIASEINEYRYASKAIDHDDSFKLANSGDAYKIDHKNSDFFNHLKFKHNDSYCEWVETCKNDIQIAIESNKKLSEVLSPDNFTGLHIIRSASGDTVSASIAFNKTVQHQDRKLHAIEMEGAGLAKAAYNCGDKDFIMIRGVSDNADLNKELIENIEGAEKTIRKIATKNATRFFLMQLEIKLKNADRTL